MPVRQYVRHANFKPLFCVSRLAAIPGDPERKISAQRLKEGIPIIDAVENDLKELGEEFKVSLG